MTDTAGRPALPTGDPSPFDAIRRVDELGDYWTGRDLMVQLSYDKWERFEDAVERARASLAAAKADPDVHASRLREPSGRTERINYRFTRYGAYILAMNGDVRKPAVARAQTYFAIRTREAEAAIPEQAQPAIPKTYADALRAHADEVEARERAEAKARELAPAAHAWTSLASAEGDFLVGDAAKILSRDPNISIGQNSLFKLLASLRWVYKRGPRDAWHASQQHVALDRLAERPQTFVDPDGVRQTANPQVRLTAKGIAFLHKHLGGSEPVDFSAAVSGPAAQLELTGGTP